MKYILLVIVIIAWVLWYLYFNWGASLPENWSTIASAEFQALSKNDDFTIIDIRNERELEETWVIEWLDDHKNVYNEEHVKHLESLDKEGKYLFYCAHGNRSRFLKEHLMSLWFAHVYDLEWWEAKRTEEQYPLVSWK